MQIMSATTRFDSSQTSYIGLLTDKSTTHFGARPSQSMAAVPLTERAHSQRGQTGLDKQTDKTTGTE